MASARRVPQIIRGLGGVLPRSVRALQISADRATASTRGVRQLGEVLLDELTLTGMTLLAPTPVLARPLSQCLAAAEELSGLGIDGAHSAPDPLRVATIRSRRLAALTVEQLRFRHNPALPASLAEFAGPATAAVQVCRHHGGPRPWLVWVHGAGQGNWSDLLVARVQRLHRLGFNIALPVQPGHGVRRHAWPPYPGHDPLANIAGMMRAISEVRAVLRWVAPQATSVTVAGVSLGSPVAALASHLENGVDAVAVYTPIAGLNSMIAHHLWRWGPAGLAVADALRSEVAAALMSPVDMLGTNPTPVAGRRLIVAARHDQMAYPEPAVALHDRWGGRLFWHDGGHAGHIFSRRVQAETERLLTEVAR